MPKSYTKDGANVVTFATEQKDVATDDIVTIEFEHHAIHEGNSYGYAEAIDLTLSYVYDIQITTPNTTKWTHFTYNFSVENETDWYFYENVDIITAGAAITPQNRDRNSSNDSTLTIKVITNTTTVNANLDTAVAGATILAHGMTGDKKTGGEANGRHEIILKQNEDYSLRFIATVAGYISFHLDWYEHQNVA